MIRRDEVTETGDRMFIPAEMNHAGLSGLERGIGPGGNGLELQDISNQGRVAWNCTGWGEIGFSATPNLARTRSTCRPAI